MGCDKHILQINESGAVTGKNLIIPGTTVLGGTNVLDKYTRIFVTDVDLHVAGAGAVKLLIGDAELYSAEVTAEGDIRDFGVYLINKENNAAGQPLKLTITGSSAVTGRIMWGFQWAGGNRVKTINDVMGWS